MATPTPQPPLTPDQRMVLESRARYDRMIRNLAIGGVVLCPIIILLPPRKLDLYTFTLGAGFYLSADHLCTLRTGRGLVQQFSPMRAMPELPTEKAREVQRVIRQERERGVRALGEQGKDQEGKGLLERVWMGDEKEGWKEKRLEEEKRALEEGKTYTDMIFEQIWEVWNWDKKGRKDREETSEGKKD